MDYTIAALKAGMPSSEMNDLVREILASTLRSIGFFSNGIHRIADLPLARQPAEYYERWLDSTIRYLQEQDVLAADLTFRRDVRAVADLWDEWEAKASAWAASDPNRQAQKALLEACLQGLPGVLSGSQRATDVMFPNSSMHLVEGVYRGNPQADYFNDVLCKTLSGCIEQQLQTDPERRIRIIEIGAGTGGTTAALLPIVQRYPVEEYCYTDLSKAFLMHAQKNFQPQCPVLTTSIFDVSRPLDSQSVAANHYDFAIAANVLHATANIRETVRNAKAALKNQGVLLLNEISAWSLFNHLTFGLLEGWWLYEDAAVRLPGSPGLSPEKWREILTAEGFESIVFPAEAAHQFGQQIVGAVSNGWTRQRTTKSVAPQRVELAHAKPPAVPGAQATRSPSSSAALIDQLAADHTRQIITAKLSEALRMDAEAIRGDAPFADFGVDSIIGVNLVRTISEALQIELETTSLFEYSTVDELAQYILKNWHDQITVLVSGPQGAQETSTSTPAEVEPGSEQRSLGTTRFAGVGKALDLEKDGESAKFGTDPIAIIGISGRFAESEGLEAFWQHLAEGHDLVKEVSRWSPEECVMSESSGHGSCSHGSFIDSIDRFDAAFFGISALEATYMDPQQRLFLEESWRALEDAGYAGAGVHEKQCGVYVGCGASSYDELAMGDAPPQAFWGNSQAVIPARIAYCLNLQGPAIAVDTACSSSLVAIHLACQGLWARETEMAVAGGVFLQATPGFYQVANRAGMLSPDGKCYSFDARANGFVPGEGVGAVVLKRLREAVADGDHIHGVIAGSGINQDGRSNGLVAPNGRAQERLERFAYDRFKIDPATIQVVEAHGTGTLLGDSVEYAALSRAFRESTDKSRFCALGTVKTNIGHASTAAGIAGVLKILLSLRHRQIPPSLHFEKGNPAIDFAAGPFYVNTELTDWNVEGDGVRRAVISSFGFSGTNAHLIIEEAPAAIRSEDEEPAYLIALSARSGGQLKQQVRNLLAHLERTPNLAMADLSFSLLIGRTHYDHRLACVARDQSELVRLLEQWSEAGPAPHVYVAELQEGKTRERASLKKFGAYCIQNCKEAPDAGSYRENLAAIAELYVQGYALEFPSLFPRGARRIPLPTYPFAGERYWLDGEQYMASEASVEITPLQLQPHGNTSNEVLQSDDPGDLRAWLQNDLSRMVADLLNLGDGSVSPDKVLLDLGLDSIGLTTFANAINDKYQLDITPVLFFDHPSIGEIAKHLAEQRGNDLQHVHAGAPSASRAAVQTPPRTPAAGRGTRPRARVRSSRRRSSAERRFFDEPIAIVGIAGVMPQSEDLDAFWTNLENARDLVTVIPEDRWRWENYYGDPLKEMNKSNSKWGGFLKEIDKFDPLFFGISPREAQMMDPQQRIFLEIVWKAVEDSGQRLADLSGTKTGVFVGVGSNDYTQVLRGLSIGMDGYSAPGNTLSVLANRVSFLLNLRGPSAPIDTACSSSLVALHRAVESIHAGSSDMAIVGGVQIMLSPEPYVAFGATGMLSPDGKCKTFDKRANGYVRGEGVGAMFLKPLAAAEADGNPIYAVIRATAENHGGRVTTLTAPNPSAQTALLIEAYEKARIDPTTVGYIECHGTGTSLGDPIEIQALSDAFSELYRRHNKPPAAVPHCGLASVKTNIGHLETAAGVASVLKVLLAMKHKEIPASLHFEEINPYIKLEGTPFYIADKLTPWVAATGPNGAPVPRRAGVSSFGFGGANAHVVLEEYIPPTQRNRDRAQGPQLIVLSAKNADRLKAYAQSMLAYLEKEEVELADFAYTLQVGRDEMPARAAMVVSSLAEARQKFAELVEGREHSPNVYQGNTRTAHAADGDGLVQALLEQKELAKLAELWVSGTKIDWSALHRGFATKRLSLPTYPFASERHWPSAAAGSSTEARRSHGPSAAAALHPLIHRNVSTLAEQKFASRFSGDEFYFADHRVETQKMLPGVAYLEMARAAGELAANAPVRVIRNVTWQRPLIAGSDEEEVEVSLAPIGNDVEFSVRTVGKEGPIVHCTGKLAYSPPRDTHDVLDLAGIRERCTEQVVSGRELYGPVLSGSGLELGRSFQVVQSIYANRSESLAILQLPEHLKAEVDQFWLHPALMDGALHTCIGLYEDIRSGKPLSLNLPFSIGEVQILHSLKDLHYGYATRAQDPEESGKLNVDLLDERGTVLVRIKGFVLRPVQRREAKAIPPERADQPSGAALVHSVVPVWNPVRLDPDKQIAPPASTRILLLGSDQTHIDWVRKSYPEAQLLPVAPTSSADTIAKAVGDCTFDQLLWIAPDVMHEPIIEQQEQGVLAVFRIIKALLQSGYAGNALQWTIVTERTQRVTVHDRIQPAHAGIAGLIGSLAKEYPRWELRLLDVDSLASVSARECLSLPWDRGGNGLAHRQGEWFQQGLARIENLPEAKPPYRQDGVYVVIGGAGGVGEVWSRFMIERYQANIVWIGRRERNAEIDAKIDSLARLGRPPLYISADATDLKALEQAGQTVLQTYGAVHGVVHSAIVLHDQSIARMDESVFRASLSAKVDVSVNMDRVFGKQELDFMLFFSSMISFIKSAGQSNYSAGCTFKDSFAHKLQQERAYPVRIMNWGYWGSVGAVADESHRKLMAQTGIASIEPEEGMAALQALAGSDVTQMALIKTLNAEAAAGFGLSETITWHPKTTPAILPQVQRAVAQRLPATSIASLEQEVPTAEMTELVTEILASSLSLTDGALDKRYERWLSSTLRFLRQQGVLGDDSTFTGHVRALPELWPVWEEKRALWTTNANLSASIALLEVCLKALPGVLSGKQPATDVIFPNSSMHLVEAVYRGNAIADYFNDVLGGTLRSCLEELVQADGNRKIRILEIGAGTGGTTAAILPLLQRFPIEDYCYTDVSKAFLMHAEKHFRPHVPALTTAVFDVSRPLAGQAIKAGHYDVAIAANVLHATPSIRETLRNAKAVLKNQGVLLLSEISEWSLFSHLTFGLLEGWWLYEDTAVRLPGSPGLAPAKWQEILADEGFESIIFPAEEAHRFGQQIVAASSNGWVRQRVAKHTAPQPVTAPQSRRMTEGSSSSAEVTERMSGEYIRRIITGTLAEVLKLDPAMIQNDDPFADYGVDSIIGVNLVSTISERLQIELETTKLFEYSTVNQLAEYIQTHWQDQIAAHLARVQDSSQKPGDSTDRVPAALETRSEHRFISKDVLVGAGSASAESGSRDLSADRIAIIGMSGRFAESESLEELWQNLKEGKDLVRKVSRWSTTDCVIEGSAGARYCSDGSFVDSIDRFDPSFFRISPEEAICMDPQQRLFLEESWKALEDAGYVGKGVREKQCGVYVGCMTSNYAGLLGADRPPQALWGNSESFIPTRIAYYLDLQGPAIAVDTVCSGSLVAIHLACQSLWSGETEMALAGGVFLQATPGFYQVANRAGMLSPEGKCYSFDERASGFVPGEGVGVVVLKRLRDALADGDHIHGVIAGSGINQDGSSNGLVAPNSRAQERLERAVYDRFEIDPATIQFMEAHGTGTLLGDSIEYGALSRAFGAYTDRKQFCAIGSVKTNIGHTVPAAGVAAVLKVLLSLKHRQIPPSLHFQKGNPGIAFESGPFYVNTQLKEWTVDDDRTRRAAISAFGMNGTNAHLVIEEAPSLERAAVESAGYVVVLSARTGEQLNQYARDLLALLESTPGMSMNDVSFTLFVGRMHFTHRLACVARNQEELIQRLGQWVETGAADQVHVSEVQENRIREHASLKKLGDRCIQECRTATPAEYLENLAAIADLYVQGYSLDFHALFSGDSRRIPLPTYPFARERYWPDAVGAAVPRVPAAPSARLHPLLHANTSTLGQQSYGCTLTGAELFLRGTPKVVSEAAYLEMARAAMENAACIPRGSSVVELQDIVWANPLVVDGNKQMTIALFATDDEHVSYEIYSGEGEREIIHCQGRASFEDQSAPARVDLDALRRQMQDGQLLAHLSLPASDRDSGYVLHPSLLSDALRAASSLIAGTTVWLPSAAERIRIVSPCTEEVFVWARHAQGLELDIDLIDADGNVCVQMRRLSFYADEQAAEPAGQRSWLFAREPAAGGGGRIASMGAVEKMALFLRQETALQLQKAIEEILTDQSFFDLGLTSLGMTHVVQNICRLLDENLSPSVLFDYRDIESLAAYLAMTYPARIDAVAAVRQVDVRVDPGVRLQLRAAQPARFPRRRHTPREQTSVTASGADVSIEQILESVSWQEASVHDGYEKVTF